MMKALFTSTILSLIHFYSQAQYSFSPSTTLFQNQDTNELTYDSIAIINNSQSKLSLYWNLISLDTTGGSHFGLCASGKCYLNVPSTGDFPVLYPNEPGWVGMHFWSGNNHGINKVKIFVYEAGNPFDGDTLTFILNVVSGNGIIAFSKNNSISIYPNPTKDDISILSSSNELFSIYAYNSLGQKLGQAINCNTISLKVLKSGNYFIVLKDKNGYHYTQTIQKIK